jgi:YVTN family beta-propeller protein
MGIARAKVTTIAADDAGEAAIDVWGDGRQMFDEFDEEIIVRRELSPMTGDPDELQSPECWFHRWFISPTPRNFCPPRIATAHGSARSSFRLQICTESAARGRMLRGSQPYPAYPCMTDRFGKSLSFAGLTGLAGLLIAVMPATASAQMTAYAFVPNNTSNNVSKVQTQTNTVVGGPIAVGLNPHGAIVLPHGRYAYITNFDSNTVVAIDVISGAVSAPIAVGVHPFGLAATADGRKVYVANFNSNDVSVIDTVLNNMVVATIPVGTNPTGVTLGPDGKI